jgi:phosphoglycolate phosphatase-like HAD superfamily hydrolase
MKLFVWDFHGVLEKGTDKPALEISNKVLEKHGYSERFTEDDIGRLKGGKWWQFFEYLLPGEPHRRHVELGNACYEDVDNNPEKLSQYVKPNDGAHEVLGKILEAGHQQILISNTIPENLEVFLRIVGMEGYFHRAFATGGLSKNEILEEFLDGREYGGIVIIGDSAHDMKLKDVAGGTTYLYSRTGKFRGDGDYKIDDLRELLGEL